MLGTNALISRLVCLALAALGLAACGAAHDPQSAPGTANAASAANAASTANGASGEQDVSPGINAVYLDPNMNPTEIAHDFESEAREFYSRRDDVVRALDLQPGMAVADIGAGSGFYTELFAAKVGPSGRVYAVEISPQWIKYLRQKFERQGLTQAIVVEGGEHSTRLAPGSIDLAFASDAYHHFEYPADTLASIYQALRPGGRWVVLDYDRIPGVTPPSRLEHLRLDRETAIREIVAAGFQLERLIDIGLHDCYFAVFSRS